MVSIADLRLADFQKRLVPGSVIGMQVSFEDGTTKEKRLVVLYVTDTTVCVVINSEISPAVSHHPERMRAQVAMPQSDHDFLNHDSHVDCSRLRRFKTISVLHELVAQPNRFQGKISVGVRDEILEVLKISSTIPPAQRAPAEAALLAIEWS